jgi:hypothetical protein
LIFDFWFSKIFFEVCWHYFLTKNVTKSFNKIDRLSDLFLRIKSQFKNILVNAKNVYAICNWMFIFFFFFLTVLTPHAVSDVDSISSSVEQQLTWRMSHTQPNPSYFLFPFLPRISIQFGGRGESVRERGNMTSLCRSVCLCVCVSLLYMFKGRNVVIQLKAMQNRHIFQ